MKIFLLKDRRAYKGCPLLAFSIPQGVGALPHIHDFYEIALVCSGHSIHGLYDADGNKTTYGVMRGDIFAVMPGEVHSFEDNHDFKIYNLAFMPELLEEERETLATLPSWSRIFGQSIARRKRLHLLPMVFGHAEKLFLSMMRELTQSTGADYHYLSAKSLFYEYLVLFGSYGEEHWMSMPGEVDSRIFKAARLMEANPLTNRSVPQLAKSTGMCYSGFVKKFKQTFGLSPLEYSISLRLEHVRHLLEETKITVSEIAQQTGFYDSNHLLKHFRHCHGTTPSQYRKQFQN